MDAQELELRWRTTLGSIPEDVAAALATFRPPPPATVAEAPPATATATTPVLGHFELQAELARGGMGVVHRARQASLDREVAVKRMLGSNDAALRERFVAEALATGQLAHPNIVPVHELGRTDSGELFLAMKLVTGSSWHDELRGGATRNATGQLATLISVCQAVAFAHSRSIVHRDLKPANVMLGEFGEVLVMDWGLAASFGPRDARSPVPHVADTRSPLGTPAYMAPELAEGRGADQGPSTDVYLLGAILHEILTGRPPHARTSFLATLTAASEGLPPVFDATVPAELQEICTRALVRNPAARFASVVAFREALEGYVQHQGSVAIAAAAETALTRAGDGGDAYSRLSDAIAGFRQARTLWAGNPQAVDGERRAHRALAERALAHGDLALAETHATALDAPLAKPILDAVAARRARVTRTRRLLRGLQVGLALAVVLLVGSLSYGLKVSHDAQLRERAVGHEARLRAARLEVGRLWDHKAAITDGSLIDPMQKVLADTALVVSRIAALETETGDGGPDAEVAALRASADLLVSRTLEDALERSPRVLGVDSQAGFAATAVSPDGKLIAAGGMGDLALWDRATGRPVRELEGVLDMVRALAFSPDGRILAVGDAGHTATVFDVATGRILYRLSHEHAVPACAFSPDGHELLTGSLDRTLRLWDARTGAPRRTLAGHRGEVHDAAFTPSGREIVSGSSDGRVRVWDAATGAPVRTIETPPDVAHLAVSRDGLSVMTASDEGDFGIWELTSGVRLARFSLTSPGVQNKKTATCGLSPDGSLALGWTLGNSLHAWDRASGKLVWEYERAVHRATFSPDGRDIVVGRGDGGLAVLDAATGKPRLGFELVRSEVSASAIATDGKALATGCRDGSVRLWDLERGVPVWSAHDRSRPVSAIAFGPGGVEVLTGATDGTVCLWDAATGALLAAFAPGHEAVRALAVAQDGRSFALAAGKSVRVVGLPSGKVLNTAGPFAKPPFFVGFTGDGREVVAVDESEIALINRNVPRSGTIFPRETKSPYIGATILRARDEVVTATADEVIFWTLTRGRTGRSLGLRGPNVVRFAVSVDGRTLATLMDDGTVERTSTDGWPPLSHGVPADALDCGFAANGVIVVVGRQGWIHLVRPPFGPMDLWKRNVWGAPARGSFSPDGRKVLVSLSDRKETGRITLHDTETGVPLRTLVDGPVALVQFERDGRSALGAMLDGKDSRLVFWDPVETAPLTTLANFASDRIWTFGTSPRGDRVAVGFESGALRLLERATGATVYAANDTREEVELCQFSPDGSVFHVVWKDGTLETHAAKDGALIRAARVEGPVGPCALSPDGTELLVGTHPASSLYRLDPFERLFSLEGHRGLVVFAAFLGTNELVTATNIEGVLRIWDHTTGHLVRAVFDGGLVAIFEPTDPAAPLAGVSIRGNIVHFARELPPDPRRFAPELRASWDDGMTVLVSRLRNHGTIAPRTPESIPALAPESAPIASLEPLAPERYEERGVALLLGRGVAPGGAAAGIAWLRSAAASGSGSAATRLAWALERGLGARNPGEAKRLRERASGDDALARVLHAVETRDRPALERAAAENEPDALIALAELDPDRARELLGRASALGDPKASLRLADFVLARDPLRSIALYERAGELGERDAWVALGRIFTEGKVVAADETRAGIYRKRAEPDEGE